MFLFSSQLKSSSHFVFDSAREDAADDDEASIRSKNPKPNHTRTDSRALSPNVGPRRHSPRGEAIVPVRKRERKKKKKEREVTMNESGQHVFFISFFSQPRRRQKTPEHQNKNKNKNKKPATMPTASRSRCTPSCSRWASG